MKKNLNFKLVAYLLVTTFIISAPGSVYSMDTPKSKAQWVKTKASRVKEKTLDRLVKRYRATQELRRKKAAGTATPAELKVLQRRMRNIQRVAVVIGITLASIAAIAGGTVAYREYRKRERRRLAEKEGAEAAEVIALARADTVKQRAERRRQEDEAKFRLKRALDAFDTGEIKRLLKAGADPNTKLKRWGKTPLHYFKSTEIAQIFINAGANLNAKDFHGNTPLHERAWEGGILGITFLLEAGADPLIRNNRGQLPSEFTSDFRSKQLLLDAMAKQRATTILSLERGAGQKIPSDILKIIIEMQEE